MTRKVMIGTPCYDGKVDARFADSLVNTVKLAIKMGIDIHPVYMPNDALIQRSRNDLVKIAIEGDVDDLIFIDSDQAWDPRWVMRLLSHQVDVVGGAVPKKSDVEMYNVRSKTFPIPVDRTGLLLKVDGLGTGFLRISKAALRAVWDFSLAYRNEGRISRMVFDVKIIDGDLYSEDTVFCESLKACGYDIYVDPTITCSHFGTKQWDGDFAAYLKKIGQP